MSVFELQTGDSISAFDAGFQQETLGPNANADDFDASGPNRFSIWIPSEQVTVNMGNAVHSAGRDLVIPRLPGEPQPPPSPLNHELASTPIEVDAGFVVQTDNHVHFHTFGFPTQNGQTEPQVPNLGQSPVINADRRTVLRLGTPTSVVTAGSGAKSYASQSVNALKTPTVIGTTVQEPYNEWNGYAMVTEGGAYQETWGNNVIVSGNADVRIAGQRSVLIGSPSDVHIMASGPDILAKIVGNTSNDDDFQGSGYWVDEQSPLKKLDAALAVVSLAVTAYTTFDSFYHMQCSRPVTEGAPGWKGYLAGSAFDKFNDAAGTLGSLIGPVVAIISATTALEALSPSEGPQSSVTLYASKNFNAFAARGATVRGEVSASVTGGAFASMSSTVATSLSSIVSTTISGAATSISGMLSVGMSSMIGTATVTGKTSAQLSSWGKVFVAGNDDVQVNSMDKNVYVHGKTGFYVGCGSGASSPVVTPVFGQTGVSYADGTGYGIVGFPDSGMLIGKMTYANKFATPIPDNKVQISLDSRAVILQHGQTSISVEDQDIYIGKGLGSAKIHIG